MSNSSDLYNNLLKEATNNKNKLSKQTISEIKKLYNDVADDLIKKASTVKGGFTKAWLADYEKYVRYKMLELDNNLVGLTSDSIKSTAEIAASVQGDFLSYINNKYKLDIDKEIIQFAYNPNSKVIGQIIQGGFYKDNRSLSDRIWTYSNGTMKDIQYVLTKGMAEQKSYLEIIKDLEKYVNPSAKKDWNFGQVYPNLRNKTVDYNAQRLLRTSMNHMFYSQNVSNAKNNPYAEAMHWELSPEHGSRQVDRFGEDECDDYANSDYYNLGQGNFPTDKVPVPHPNCLCIQTIVIPKSLDEIGRELRDWIRGDNNKLLNQLFNGLSNEKNEIDVSKDDNSDIINSKKWLNSSFSSQKQFERHFKHLIEYNNITPEEYLNIARELLSEDLSEDVEGFISKQGWLFKYRKSTNDFAMGHPKGTISTLFKPREKYEYFLGEKEKYK